MSAPVIVLLSGCGLYLASWCTAMAICGSEFEHRAPENALERALWFGCYAGGALFLGGIVWTLGTQQ
jgi:hypothetical protein